MMSETTLLESRVDKIERDNRRLKLTVGALLLALAAVPLIGAVMPEQIPDVIRAGWVLDGGGSQRPAEHPGALRLISRAPAHQERSGRGTSSLRSGPAPWSGLHPAMAT